MPTPYHAVMGLTNYQHALRKKYASLTGELVQLRERVEKINRNAALLPDLEARADRLAALVASAEMLLAHDSPDWTPDHTPPVKRWTHGLPVPFGSCGRRAMDLLRGADRALTVREIAREVLRQAGERNPDRATLQRAQNAVDSSLRAHRRRGMLESSDTYPAQWRVTGRAGIEFDP